MSEPLITIRLDDLLPAAQVMAHTEPDEENDWLPDVDDEELRVAMIQAALFYWVRDRVDEMVHDAKAEIENLPSFATAPFEHALANAEELGRPLPVPWPAQMVLGPVEIDVWRGPRQHARTAHVRRLTLLVPTDNSTARWQPCRNSSELAREALDAFDTWRLANDPDAVLIRVACGWCPCPPELAARAVW